MKELPVVALRRRGQPWRGGKAVSPLHIFNCDQFIGKERRGRG